MTVDNIDVAATIKKVQQLLAEEPQLSPALRSTLDVLLLVVQLLVNRLSLTSRNSSQPPSKDRFPVREKTAKESAKKPGGQPGRVGTTLKKIDDPDDIEVLTVDRSTLPAGQYHEIGYDCRQVFDIDIRRLVTEYRAQILQDQNGQRFTAPFPTHVSKAVQYGNGVKAQAVYLSQYQLIPYQRVQEQFQDQLRLPISVGSIHAFNQQAYALLEQFEQKLIAKLLDSPVLHADETGINIDGKTHWLHCISSPRATLYHAHAKRGMEAMKAMAVLPRFTGILVHDHWKPYFQLLCLHALCNAHHLRELAYAHEQEQQAWAERMIVLLQAMAHAINAHPAGLPEALAADFKTQYRAVLKVAEIECPPPDPQKIPGQRGRTKRSKSRNLLERLINYETETLRFLTDPEVPFTNNQGESDIRMTKLHQKISGCFRSQEGAGTFCRVRSYLSTCR
ncbi:MAG: IS66 family transposase, partial [Methylococcaceae bacterium]|nr:IS66 family transposase [Methylococcaceae bacterium]